MKPITTPWIVTALSALLTACGALGMAATGMASSFGTDMLLDTVRSNFDDSYAGKMDSLLKGMLNGGAATTTDGLPALELDVTLLREVVVDGRAIPVPIADGDTLRDGVGRDTDGDNLKIQVRPGAACFLYVISVDSTGWAQPLFPGGLSRGRNPVAAQQTVTFPDGNEWLYLDEYRGIETVYVLASRDRRDDIEAILDDLSLLERDPPSEPESVEEPPIVTRGFGGTRPSSTPAQVVGSDGTRHQLAVQSFLGTGGASGLVVTRWFRHE